MSPGRKRIALTLVTVVLLGLSYPIYVVGAAFNIWQPVTRPSGVSSRAQYVDAFKSAAWFDCSIDHARDMNICQAWDPRGNLIAFGKYRIENSNRAATELELRPRRVHEYPGHPNLAWIIVREEWGQTPITLVPVNDSGQPLERFDVR
jgi:hypothetical protein